MSFITAPSPSEYTEEERHILLVIPQWTSDMLTILRRRVNCYFSLLLGRDDAFRDPDPESGCVLKRSFRSNVMTGLLWGLPVAYLKVYSRKACDHSVNKQQERDLKTIDSR